MKKKTAVLAVLLGAVSISLLAGLMTAGAETRPEDLSQPESVLPAECSVPAGGEAEPEEEPVQEAPVPADYSGWRQWTDGGWSYYRGGERATGWLQLGGSWYLLDVNGIMQTGWQRQQDAWYFLDSSGAMRTGWVRDGGKWYFLDASGAMLTGFVHDGKGWYYLEDSGAWVEGYTDAEVTSGGRKLRIVNGVAYVDGILVANKKYPLPRDYAPGQLTSEVQEALAVMQQAAAKDGLNLYVVSGYRSYDYQAQLYQNYCNRDGQAAADRYSARPGYSEHQTGLAFDLNSTSNSFAGTAEAKWLAAHAHEYGFIIRYPKGKESVTGYQYEPWHLRYLGTETAEAVYDSGLCLEEYLGISSYYTNDR